MLKFDRVLGALFSFSARHPWKALAFLIVMTGIAALGLPSLSMDATYDSLVNKRNPEKQAYDRVVGDFGSDYITYVLVDDPDLFTPEKLTRLHDLAVDLDDLARVERVKSLYTLGNLVGRPDELDTTPVLADPPATQAEADAARRRALGNRFAKDAFINPSGDATAIHVIFRPEWDDGILPKEAYQSVETTLEAYRGDFASLTQLGPPRVVVESREGIIRDGMLLAPIGIIVMAIIYRIAHGSMLAALAPITSASLSVFWIYGLIGLIGLPLNVLLSALPAILIAVGSTEDSHLVAALLKQRRQDLVPVLVVRNVGRRLGVATVLTAATTIFGFLSSGIAAVPMIRDFAVATALGLFLNLIVTFVVIPLWFIAFGAPMVGSGRGLAPGSRMSDIALHIARAINRRSRTEILTTILLATVIVGLSAATLKPSFNPMTMLQKTHSLIADFAAFEDRFGGADLLMVAVETGTADAFRDPAMLKRIAALDDAVSALPDVAAVTSIADHLRMTNRAMFADDEAADRIPDTAEIVEQYLLFFNEDDLRNFVSADWGSANLLVRHDIVNSYDLLELRDRLELLAQAEFGDTASVHVTGQLLLIAESSLDLMRQQMIAFVIVVIGCAVFIAAGFRSIRIGVIALLPCLLPALFVFGAMAVFAVPFNPGTAVAALAAFGLAVDDTIHLFREYFNVRRSRGDLLTTLIEAKFLPVTATSIALIAAFLTFSLSEFRIITEFGLLGAFALFVAWLLDAILTPVLIVKFIHERGSRRTPR